jgi:DNA invertase Pin-like site-specific DNA recombinase
MAKKVTVIPASRQRYSEKPIGVVTKRKACGYARVSTEHEEQANSYETQMAYYKRYIQEREDLEYVGMYSDEGITATNTKHRAGFNQMVADALDGKIDLIITKSVSRFARNTVDSLTTVRRLKEKGVEIYFEKENIWTLDSKGELLITIMSSLAQEESRSISENTTWGQRKRMADGHGCISFSHFLGYDKGPNGEFVINEKQAEIVRRIYTEFVQGKSLSRITMDLTRDGIKTPAGKNKWYISTVKSILGNEKYKGDCLMQKYYTEDFLTKKIVKNQGELQQYYVKNHHPAIVSEGVFEQAQVRLNEMNNKRNKGVREFSSIIICGDCGGTYGSKVWHSNDKYRKVVYRCNAKYKDKKCSTPAIDETRLKEIFVEAINKLLVDKDEILDNLRTLISIKTKSLSSPDEIRKSAVVLDSAEKEYRQTIDQQKINPIPIHEFEKISNVASKHYDEAVKEYEEMLRLNDNIKEAIYELQQFAYHLQGVDGVIENYDYNLMRQTVKQMRVYKNKTVEVEFFSGEKVNIKI